MSIRNLPAAPEARPRAGIQCDLSPKALEAWRPDLRAAAVEEQGSEHTINIYEPIGYDWWTGGGVTAKGISDRLQEIGPGNDVVVNVNSPGGDVFEGLAIYNLLREHNGKVTVKVLGLAASAASFISMAGDDILIGRAAFFMIHNGWVFAAGNRNDFRDIANWLEPFDNAIADIYADRTGIGFDDVSKQMDAETWINGKTAVEKGWATDFIASDQIAKDPSNQSGTVLAQRKLEAALAKGGMSRSQRRELISNYKSSMLSAAGGGGNAPTGMPRAAAPNLSEALQATNQISKLLSGEQP